MLDQENTWLGGISRLDRALDVGAYASKVDRHVSPSQLQLAIDGIP
jgi:hypothetical protein